MIKPQGWRRRPSPPSRNKGSEGSPAMAASAIHDRVIQEPFTPRGFELNRARPSRTGQATPRLSSRVWNVGSSFGYQRSPPRLTEAQAWHRHCRVGRPDSVDKAERKQSPSIVRLRRRGLGACEP